MPGDNVEIMLFCVTGKVSKMSAISWNSRILFSHEPHDRRVLHSSPMDAGSQVTRRSSGSAWCNWKSLPCNNFSMCVIEINVSLLLRESQAANDLIFFPFRRGRFILEKILRDVLCACLWQEAFLLCFCLVLWDVWSVFWGLLVSVPVCACTYNCSVAMELWGSALAIRHKPTVAWESMSPRQWLLSGRF